MKRSMTYFVTLITVCAVWLALFNSRDKFQTVHKLWIDAFPWYALICLGCYCLFRLGCGVLFFNDCPSEIPKLEKVS
jgi:hypothetical protein